MADHQALQPSSVVSALPMTEAEASVATEEKEEVKAPEPKMDLMGAPRLVHRLLRAPHTPHT